VGDQKHCQSYHLSDSHKTTNLGEGFPEEDSPEAEDFQEEGDSLEEEDTQVEEEYRLEDHPEVVGDHHRYPYHRNHSNKGNW